MGYVKQVEVNGKEIEVRRSQKKRIRQIISRHRKENHLAIKIQAENQEVMDELKLEIMYLVRKLDHKLDGGLSMEIQFMSD